MGGESQCVLLWATRQRFGWAGELPVALQTTLTLALASSEHQDPNSMH